VLTGDVTLKLTLLKLIDYAWKELERMAKDRGLWRSVVCGPYTGISNSNYCKIKGF